MTAPVVGPGGASPPSVTGARGARRSEEAAQADGAFAALLAALAPAVNQPAGGAAPAAEGSLPVSFPILLESGGAGQPPALAEQLLGRTVPDAGMGPATPQLGDESPGPLEVPVPSTPIPDEPVSVATAQGQALPGESAPTDGADAARTPVQFTPPARVAGAGPEGRSLTDIRAVQAEPADGSGADVAPDPAADVQGLSGEAQAGPPAAPVGGEPAEAGVEDGTGQSPELQAGANEALLSGDAAEPDVAAGVRPSTPTDPAGEAAPAAEASQARGLERLTAGRLQVQQVVEEFTKAVRELPDGQYRLTLRLHPEHLGEVRLELHMSGREVHAALEVANPDARQALESGGEQLRQSLSDAGYNLAGFEVATGEGRQPRRGPEEEPDRLPQFTGRSRLQAKGTPTAAIGRVRSPGSRGGRLDTMA
ncbi:flagellar hook-length control protein FliK [Symbiobacterium terraclitae]|uniref:Flagellar hook-length control protein FliK n=1 Tax=Symbiobacterium terraclitae TaxID=557451 RepID=A0ABS4JRD0_9FIRM|nr:flagellar hook-length control protein FliK [Symbiobacterium terraclitae]MBP2016999.1 flagellar hook-length control protein FliK [Symbiobacterium terraclitae]